MKSLPYIVAVAIFFAVGALYFAPQFSGETLSQTDVQMYDGMKKDISEHRREFDEDPQWTGGMFGGMPAYLISVDYPAMIIRDGAQAVMNFLGEPMALMFLAMTGFWLMLLMCGVNPWLAIFAALAYGLSTYNILIIEAGHITKMRAIGYAPMLVGAVVMTFQRNQPWLGAALAALFGALLIGAGHPQITYYFVLVVVAFWIGQLAITMRERGRAQWWRFSKATAVLAGSALLAAGANFSQLWYTFENSPETIRGGSEVASVDGGLDLDYATEWSYGVGESWNMFVPNARGGASWGGFSNGDSVANVLRHNGLNPRLAEQLPSYWGMQAFTGGPTYLGAVIVFLAIFAVVILSGRKKWWVVGVSVLGLLLAWGHNAMWFTKLGFALLPGLDKFRTVSMALVILQWSAPFLAAIAVNALWKGELPREKVLKGLKWSLGIAGGAALFFALFGGWIFDFSSVSDGQFAGIPGLVEAMRSERAALLRADAWRSLVFVIVTASVLAFWVLGGVKKLWWLVVSLCGLVLADLVEVDRRFVAWDDFAPKTEKSVVADSADRAILEDKEPGYRVFNTANPFNEALTSYFHRSVGGYHGAKLRRYQDVIDEYLSQFDLSVLNLLNTKYFIITDPETGARMVELNPDANGAAWFVDEVVTVDGARAELDALATIDNKTQAVVDRRFDVRAGGAGTVALVEYRPNYLKYESSSAADGLAVFSEIYYDKGWTAYIDGERADYLRADYILRAMVVPAGKHTIEWKFRAPRFALVEGITLSAGILILVSILIVLIWQLASRNGGSETAKIS